MRPVQWLSGALCPKSHPARHASLHWQFVVAVGATSMVAFIWSKPCVMGELVMPPRASLSL